MFSYFGNRLPRHAPAEYRRASDQTTYSTYPSYNSIPVHEASKRYSQRPSYDPEDQGYTYASPNPQHARRSSGEYVSTEYYTTEYVAPKRSAHNTGKGQSKGGSFFFSHSKSTKSQKHSPQPNQGQSPSQKDRKSRAVFDDEGYYSAFTNTPQGSPPPQYHDDYNQDTYNEPRHPYSEQKPQKAYARTTSYSYFPDPQPTQQRYTDPRTSPKATAADAARAGIPAGYSYKNWDPTEEPILLLGSVFDANSLGKWIYDWTVFHHGPSSTRAELAGELWLALIKLAGKIKRAEEAISRIRRLDERDLVDDFLESGERIWKRFNKILKSCEDDMWRAAKKEARGKKEGVAMGPKSGCAFVDAMFGRNRNLDTTEKLMDNILLWSKRFDANCDEILRYPFA